MYSHHDLTIQSKSYGAQARPLNSARNQQFEALITEKDSKEFESNQKNSNEQSGNLFDTTNKGIPVLDDVHAKDTTSIESRLTIAFKADSIVRGAALNRRVESEEEINSFAQDMYALLVKIV